MIQLSCIGRAKPGDLQTILPPLVEAALPGRLDEWSELPDEIHVVELGVGDGHQAKVWLDEFAAACAAEGAQPRRPSCWRCWTARATFVVLARYMQVLSGDLLKRVGVPVINIHHSFLPALGGAGSYERAKERGVKLVGATAHYVTEELDAGPIIERDVVRVTHRDHVASRIRQGAEVERPVLARAVQWHCQDRVVRHGNTTMVFS